MLGVAEEGQTEQRSDLNLKDPWGGIQVQKEGVWEVVAAPGGFRVAEGGNGKGEEPGGEGSLLSLILQRVMEDYHGGGGGVMETVQCPGVPEKRLEKAEKKLDGRCRGRQMPGGRSCGKGPPEMRGPEDPASAGTSVGVLTAGDPRILRTWW